MIFFIAYLNEPAILNILSKSSVFLNGAQLKRFNYTSLNLPYLAVSTGLTTFTDAYLRFLLGNMTLAGNFTIYPDSQNVINVVAVHLSDGMIVTYGNMSVCHNSK